MSRYFEGFCTLLYTLLLATSLYVALSFVDADQVLTNNQISIFGFAILIAIVMSVVRVRATLYGITIRSFEDSLIENCILVISISMLSLTARNSIYLDAAIIPVGLLTLGYMLRSRTITA